MIKWYELKVNLSKSGEIHSEKLSTLPSDIWHKKKIWSIFPMKIYEPKFLKLIQLRIENFLFSNSDILLRNW